MEVKPVLFEFSPSDCFLERVSEPSIDYPLSVQRENILRCVFPMSGLKQVEGGVIQRDDALPSLFRPKRWRAVNVNEPTLQVDFLLSEVQ